MLSRSLRAVAKPRFTRAFTTTPVAKQKIVCALYEGGEAGKRNPDILGCVDNELGIRSFLEERGHEYIVTSDKDGPGSVVEQNLHDADVVISQPFWPIYLTRERIEKAPNLKMAITAGVGSDHVDLEAAAERGITVIEVTGSNVVSVAEHVMMQILILVRNFVPCYKDVLAGGWNIADDVAASYDLEGKSVGTVAAGRIGLRVLQRLKPFDCNLHYFDHFRLPDAIENDLGATYHPSVESMIKECDVVTINCPLHPETEDLFNADLISKMKPGAWVVNTARGKIVNAQAMADACNSGHIAGYAGDVWFPQPAPPDHPWRSMKNHAMTPHVSGTSLDAQKRYADGTQDILRRYFDGITQEPANLIVDGGKLASASYTEGDATSGAL